MEKYELGEDIKINPTQLDVECVQQAELFFKWAEKLTESKINSDRLKLKLEIIEAQLNMECRKQPENFGLVKTTEATISAAVKSHNKYIEAYKEYLEEKENTTLLEKAVMAMEQKKRMIESLVTLHGQQYFAGPSVPRNLLEVWQDHQAKQEKSVNQKQKSISRKRKEK